MLVQLIGMIGLFAISYSLVSLFFRFFILKNGVLLEYRVKYDAYLYLFVLFFLSVCGVYYILPDFYDTVTAVLPIKLCVPFVFAALIYLVSLFEKDYLLNVCILACSVLVSFLLLENDVLLFSEIMPWWAEKLLFGLIVAFVTYSVKILNVLPGIFSTFMTMALIGVAGLSLIGGLPLKMGLISVLWAGAWLSYLQFNMFETKIQQSEGVLMSATFLFCMFFLMSVNEFSAASVFILMTYPIVEFLWAITHRYIFKSGFSDLSYNTVYMSVYQRGVAAPTLYLSVFKLGAVNMVLALFQLYAPNEFTLPFFAVLVNFWLLSKLNHFDEEKVTLKSANEQFTQNVKENFNELKDALKGDKRQE